MNVYVPATLASEVDAAYGAHDVLVAFDLVDEVSFLVLEVLVAAGAVFVFGGGTLVFFHLPDCVEAARAVGKSAEHFLGRSWVRHVDGLLGRWVTVGMMGMEQEVLEEKKEACQLKSKFEL